MKLHAFVALLLVVLWHWRSVDGTIQYIRSNSGWTHRNDPYKYQLEQLEQIQNGKFDYSIKLDKQEQGMGRSRRNTNVPQASSPFILLGDNHRYANVHYSGDDSDVVFVLTYDFDGNGFVSSSILYRSDNYGKNFTKETAKFPSDAKLHPNYRISPVDKTILIFPDDVQQAVYVSHDEGLEYQKYNILVDQTTLLFHPSIPVWVLGLSTGNTLMVSTDLGKSWNTVSENVRETSDYSWGVPGVDWDVKTVNYQHLGRIFYNAFDPGTAGDLSLVSLYVSTYPFNGPNQLFDANLGKHDAFRIDGRFIFVQRTIDHNSNEVELLVSADRKPFNVAKIPFEEPDQHYHVVTYRSAQALVVVKHSSGVQNLYLSNSDGTYYSLSLEDIAGDFTQGYLDFEPIDSMNGTFIANQKLYDGSVRTVITFDNGAEWAIIEAPPVDLNGTNIDCGLPLCSLHFHMSTSTQYSRSGVYSRASAPGLIVAHGNYGTNLQDNADVYISRDGGLHWEQTLVSSWGIEIIDHGGMLVAAKDYHNEDDNNLWYSCDEGMHWNNFQFSTTETVIWGVVTEPGETTTEVTLFGSENRSSPEWAIISINFATVFQRVCLSSDYLNWTVSDGRIEDQACLLGEVRVIERRKASVCCLNGEEYDRTVSTTPCECGVEDFECDWGYMNDELNGGKCLVDNRFNDGKVINNDCTTGYRKIAGDTCEAGISDSYLASSCTSGSHSSGVSGATVTLAVLFTFSIAFIIGLGIVLLVLLIRRKKQSGGYGVVQSEPQSIHFASSGDDDDDDALLRP